MNLRPASLVVVVLALRCTAALAQTPIPRIVNGVPTVSYPSVGALILYSDREHLFFDGLCSGTLVGCRTFVTAAHCVCDERAEDAASCARLGLVDPSMMSVYLQHAGYFDVESAVVEPSYSFAAAGDIAVLKLAQAPSGIAPSPINTFERPAPGTVGTLVGFGRTGGRTPDDAGLKREGLVTTAGCDPEVPDAAHICWRYEGDGSSTCSGDSGGPLFIDTADGPVLAGATSGGSQENCLAPDFSFDTDVFVYRSFIAEQAGEPLGGNACGELPAVGEDGVAATQRTGNLTATVPQARFEVEVPAGTLELRVGLNGVLESGRLPRQVGNEFNLYVRFAAPPSTTEYDCSDQTPFVFGFCRVINPQPGTWHVLVDSLQGIGSWQATVSLFGDTTAPVCVGDCDGDGLVTVDELVAGISMALGTGAADACQSLDKDSSGTVTVDEIVAAVSNALDGCL